VERVVLARHGESELSLVGRTNGDPSLAVGLTEAGREQARQLGRDLAAEAVDLCVTSEFLRARETADLALEARDVPRLVLPELNDIRFGRFEGGALADYRAWAWTHGPEEPVPGGGESRVETVARYVRGFRTVLERPEESVLVVAHSLPIRYVLNATAGTAPVPKIEQVPYATPLRLGAAELEAAVERLAAWISEPVWPVRTA
jgi:2,3-bisphosphoglycerate-dependent phosphoglycerate mutase